MTELNADDFDTHDDYAAAVQAEAIGDPENARWAIGGTAPDELRTTTEYAIEAFRGDCARAVSDDLYSAIEDLSSFRTGARIVKRQVTFGPWEYVTPEEIRNG